jgi:hypothetical protein
MRQSYRRIDAIRRYSAPNAGWNSNGRTLASWLGSVAPDAVLACTCPRGEAQLFGGIGGGVAFLALLALRPGLWLSFFLWFPLTVAITAFLAILMLYLRPPRLESDVPHNPSPGSPLGLNSKLP